MTGTWLSFLAVSLEAGGIATLMSDLPPAMSLASYLAAHALACALLTLVLLPLLPPRYRGNTLRTSLFLFTLQFSIPFLGSLGVFTGVLLALYLPRTTRETPWQEVDIPELPFQPVDMSQQIIYSEGGLRQVLREAGSIDKRLKALLATRQMAERDAVELLREALKDPADDVRLLAYSMLEQKEKALASQARRLQLALEDANSDNPSRLKRRLAQVWWEMAYLGLAQGSLRSYYLESARRLLQDLTSTLAMHNDWRLLGRCELALGNVVAARDAFEKALEQGAPQELILPYQAEVAYIERDYRRVRFCLANLTRYRPQQNVRAVIEGWL
uniref:Pellicle/biofilm biosynthesis protein PelE n=1 Tax=Marinobacter nauticus TaxID=2743 RepID=A0A455W1H7_MARNT|nr:pellicle/biofilm biosynthesis protein PelE [Marinobacter nauticus]